MAHCDGRARHERLLATRDLNRGMSEQAGLSADGEVLLRHAGLLLFFARSTTDATSIPRWVEFGLLRETAVFG